MVDGPDRDEFRRVDMTAEGIPVNIRSTCRTTDSGGCGRRNIQQRTARKKTILKYPIGSRSVRPERSAFIGKKFEERSEQQQTDVVFRHPVYKS